MKQTTVKVNDFLTLTHIKTDKFKKGFLKIALVTKGAPEETPTNSLILPVAFRGTAKYGDFRTLCRRAEELYAAEISDFNNRIGDDETIGLRASFLNDEYILQKDRENGVSILCGVIEVAADLLLHPLMRDGDVEIEKKNQIKRIESRKNDSFGYGKYRFNSIMSQDEPWHGKTLLGEVPDVEKITSETLKKRYSDLINGSEMNIFYCGSAKLSEIETLVREYFGNYGKNVKMRPDMFLKRRADKPKEVIESGKYRQGNLFIGFRTGVNVVDSDYAAMEVLNNIYGDGMSSKLFLNVREKKSLCYFCSSSYDEVKGIISVSCGIENSDFYEARDEILAQLEEIVKGNVTDTEMNDARSALVGECDEADDHPEDYETFGFAARRFGGPATIDEYRAAIEKVTKEEVIAAAKKITLDTVYFLKGELDGGCDEE